MARIELHKDYIIYAFTQLHLSANRIAKQLGVSRQGVILALKAWGVDTSYKATQVEVECSWEGCQKGEKGGRKRYLIERNTARVKLERNEPNFCCRECYQAAMRKRFS